jgi:hypothetical protein
MTSTDVHTADLAKVKSVARHVSPFDNVPIRRKTGEETLGRTAMESLSDATAGPDQRCSKLTIQKRLSKDIDHGEVVRGHCICIPHI